MMPSDSYNRDKRKRRTAHEIERNYICSYKGCSKSYGSEGSLNQHMKNKHSEYYQQYVENLGLSGGVIDRSKEFENSYDESEESESYSSSKNTSQMQSRKRKHDEIE